MKAGAIAFGKKVLLSNNVFVAAGIAATVDAGRAASKLWTGLYPRNAAKSADVGEMLLNAGISWEAPAFCNALEIAPGKLEERAPKTIVKNTARLIV